MGEVPASAIGAFVTRLGQVGVGVILPARYDHTLVQLLSSFVRRPKPSWARFTALQCSNSRHQVRLAALTTGTLQVHCDSTGPGTFVANKGNAFKEAHHTFHAS